jgi:hypothetical protein
MRNIFKFGVTIMVACAPGMTFAADLSVTEAPSPPGEIDGRPQNGYYPYGPSFYDPHGSYSFGCALGYPCIRWGYPYGSGGRPANWGTGYNLGW